MIGIFLDIETTGLDPLIHKPIDIGISVVDLKTLETKDQYQSLIKCSQKDWGESDPISLQINGYEWEEIQMGESDAVVAQELKDFFVKNDLKRKKAFFVCQNPSFDRPFFAQLISVYEQERLEWPYHWLDLASMYWAYVVRKGGELPKEMNLSKNTIAKHFGLPEETRPHKAINGVNHLFECYRQVVGFS